MGLPNILVIHYKDEPLEGIVKKIKNTYEDPIKSNIIIPNSTQNRFAYSNLVAWEYFSSAGGFSNAYVYFRFPRRLLFPTHYTLTGTDISGKYYQKKWKVYGYNAGEENDDTKWTLLAEHESTVDTFCGVELFCSTEKRSTTYQVTPIDKGFEYIRFQATEVYDSSKVFFITSATDFFGTLVNKRFLYNRSVYRKCTIHEALSYIRYLIISALYS